jgi:hypothetical protein
VTEKQMTAAYERCLRELGEQDGRSGVKRRFRKHVAVYHIAYDASRDNKLSTGAKSGI